MRVNGRGKASRLAHRARRAAVKQSDAYLAKKRAATDNFLAMLPKSNLFAVPPTSASVGGETSAVMGATPHASKAKPQTPVEKIINDAIDAAYERGKPLVKPANPSLKEALKYQRAVRRRSIRTVVEHIKKNKGQP